MWDLKQVVPPNKQPKRAGLENGKILGENQLADDPSAGVGTA